jgi:uncharacterized membrane protein YedE/YeeE
MTIDWIAFTPGSAIIGGVLIGLAASLLALFNGRIAGISGIVSQLLHWKSAPKDHLPWRVLFLIGLVSSGWIYQLFFKLPVITTSISITTLMIAGLLVGVGTRLGSGCTSGHGVCGLGRLSTRSLIATMSFMTAGFVATYLFLHSGLI